LVNGVPVRVDAVRAIRQVKTSLGAAARTAQVSGWVRAPGAYELVTGHPVEQAFVAIGAYGRMIIGP